MRPVWRALRQCGHNYTYDNDELLISAGDLTITRGSVSGRIVSTSIGSITDTWSYNSYGELTGYAAYYGTTPLYSYSVTPDALGRVDTLTETTLGTTNTFEYDYDSSGRLTAVTKNSSPYSHYNYDLNSNGTSGSVGGTSFAAVFDAHDRLTEWNVYDFTYTNAGEMSSKVNTLLSQTTSYSYDVLGNLRTVVIPSVGTVSYQADGFNRRVSRSMNGTVTAKYLYASDLRIVAELDQSNAIKNRFVYGEKVNVPEYMESGTSAYRIISDRLGSVRLVVRTSDGYVAQRLEYNEYGKVLTDTNPGFQPFGFAGGLFDPDTRLVRFGARDYDPETGRWTSKDPILFNGADTNLYGYVLQDPINKIDPDGQIWQYVGPAIAWCLLNPICRSAASNLIRYPFQRHVWDPNDDKPPRPVNLNCNPLYASCEPWTPPPPRCQ